MPQGDARLDIAATVKVEGKTGVEMEALTAVSVACLTVYDMCKAVDRGMRITEICLVEKSGGKSGRYTRPKTMSLLPVDDAKARILSGVKPLSPETSKLDQALGRVLARDLKARRDQPPFAASAMDGYALRAADVASVPARLRVIGIARCRPRLRRNRSRRRGGPHLHRRARCRAAPTPSSSRRIPRAMATRSLSGRRRCPAIRCATGASIFARAKRFSRPVPASMHRDIGLIAAMNHPELKVRRRPRVDALHHR